MVAWKEPRVDAAARHVRAGLELRGAVASALVGYHEWARLHEVAECVFDGGVIASLRAFLAEEVFGQAVRCINRLIAAAREAPKTATEWKAFVRRAKTGQYDVS